MKKREIVKKKKKAFWHLAFPQSTLYTRVRWVSGIVSTCNAGDVGLIPGPRRSPGEENGNPLQYSCLGNPMDRGAWQAIVHGVQKSWTILSN